MANSPNGCGRFVVNLPGMLILTRRGSSPVRQRIRLLPLGEARHGAVAGHGDGPGGGRELQALLQRLALLQRENNTSEAEMGQA